MGVTEEFAHWAVSTQHHDIPAAGVEHVKRSFLDWIGCALAGINSPAVRIVNDYVRAEGGMPQARVLGTDIQTTSANAAFANGVVGHVEDYDDSGSHPASYLTPTVLALGDELRLPGNQLLTAWAIGYDVSAMIGENLHPDRAWHKTAIFGTMGAVAAASKLLGLDALQTRMALGIGASEAAGVMRNFGTMTKAFHPGNAARGGIVAAKLARGGFTADPDIIEARYGYADCFGGEKCYIPAMTRFLGDVSMISSKPPSIKAWPCCSSNHRTLTGIMGLLARQSIAADDIARVEHYGYVEPGTGSLQRTEIRNGLEAKFSMEYNIAAAFIDGKVDLSTFSEARWNRGDIQVLMKRIERYHDPEAARHSARTQGALEMGRMRVFMKDGTVHDVELGPRTTLKGSAVVDKFIANASGALDRARIERVISIVSHLEQLENTRELTDLISNIVVGSN